MRIFRIVKLLYIILDYSQGILTKDTEEEKNTEKIPGLSVRTAPGLC